MLVKEWYAFLMAFGWEGNSERLVKLCTFLVANDVTKWFQLARTKDPSTWPGAEEFVESEFVFLRSIVESGRKRPRQSTRSHS